MSVFRLTALPAREGDCLVVTWGPAKNDLRHIVVDAGHAETAPLLLAHLRGLGIRRLELIVVTHVDADHIEGMLDFLDEARGEFEIGDVWFNGYRHLKEGLEGFGPVQGERLTALIEGLSWNAAFAGRAVRTADDGSPRTVPVIHGLSLTILSPDVAKLKAMVRTWEADVRGAGLEPGGTPKRPDAPAGLEALGASIDTLAATKTGKDLAKANGTSIAILAEYRGRRLLLGADAHPGILEQGLRSLPDGAPVRVDLFKVPHHGSQNNITPGLLSAVDCRRFLVSTDGTRFRHPDPVAIARIVSSCPGDAELIFNYRQPRTQDWANRPEAGERYTCYFPAEGEAAVIEV